MGSLRRAREHELPHIHEYIKIRKEETQMESPHGRDKLFL
jgi:hypothetical protein